MRRKIVNFAPMGEEVHFYITIGYITGVGSVVFAIFITVVLWFFPRGPDDSATDITIYDDYIMGREALVSLMGESVVFLTYVIIVC